MKKKVIYSFIVLLIITNFILLILLLKEKKEKIESNIEILTLNGEGTHWNVMNYKVVKTKNTIWRGLASLVYLGKESEIINSNYLKYEFVQVNKSFESKPVLVGSKSSADGGIDILSNIDKLGSISGPLSPWEDDYERTYMNISWTDSTGKENSERIELFTIDHIKLN